MQCVKRFSTDDLKHEYGLDGIRTFPWDGVTPPFGGGYCIVRPGTSTLEHVNSPDDEEEMFIAVDGEGVVVLGTEEHRVNRGDIVMIARGVSHYVRNDSEKPFHFYTIWWNRGNVDAYLADVV